MNNLLKGNPSRFDKFLFRLHSLLFGMASANLVYITLLPGNMVLESWVAVEIIWGLVYMAHRGEYMHAKGRAEAPTDDRQAYREGLRDGMREAMREAMALQSEGRLDRERLTVDDDGELAELMEAEKRKRR